MRHLPIIALLLACTLASASETYRPPEGGVWQRGYLYLKAAKVFPHARGVTVFSCNMAETQHRYQLYARGLAARSLYTIWLVDMENGKVKDTYELTSRLRPAKSDKKGTVTLAGSLPWCPMKMEALVIKYYRPGAPRDWKHGVTVLKGYLASMP